MPSDLICILRLRRLLASAVSIMAVLGAPVSAPSAMAFPLGLQTGGVGEGYVFSAIGDLEWQSVLGYESFFGKMTFRHDPRERLTAQSTVHSLKNAVSFRASPEFYIVGGINAYWHSHGESLRTHPWKLAKRGRDHEIVTHAVFERGSWILTGSIGVLTQGRVTRELTRPQESYHSETSSEVLPRSAIGLGYVYHSWILYSKLRLPHQVDYTVTAKSPNTAATTYDNVHKTPLEFSFNVLKDLVSEVQLSASLLYRAQENASQDAYQWSSDFASKGSRVIAEEPLLTDSYVSSVGARYFATPDFSIVAAFSHTSPSYYKKNRALLEEHNLGGYGVKFEVEFLSPASLRWNLGVEYLSPSSLDYAYDYSTNSVLKHQRIPFDDVHEVTVTQGKYAFLLGITYIPSNQDYEDEDATAEPAEPEGLSKQP